MVHGRNNSRKKKVRQGVDTSPIAPIPFFENLFQPVGEQTDEQTFLVRIQLQRSDRGRVQSN